jgi:hypothetical protein
MHHISQDYGIFELWLITSPVPYQPHKDPTAEDVEAWLNLNSFAARVLAREVVLWTQFPVWQLREALEKDIQATLEESKQAVVVAAEWIKQCGSVIWERWIVHFDDSDYEEDSSVGAGPLYEGRTGLCPERWQFWKQRFGAISELENLDAGTRSVAEYAKGRMESIEATGTG